MYLYFLNVEKPASNTGKFKWGNTKPAATAVVLKSLSQSGPFSLLLNREAGPQIIGLIAIRCTKIWVNVVKKFEFEN